MAAAPFCHAKLAVVANVREEDFADRMLRALAVGGKVINGRPTQVIEAKPVEPPDHSMIIPPLITQRL